MEFHIPNEFNLNGNIADNFETFIEEFSNCILQRIQENWKVLSIT